MRLEPLYTADEMRAAEAGHDVPTLMQRAGEAVAAAARQRFPEARRFTVVCGGGANGGDGRIAAELLAGTGAEVLVVEAKAGEPRSDAAALITAMNWLGRPILAVDLPSGVDASTGEVAGVAVEAAACVTF